MASATLTMSEGLYENPLAFACCVIDHFSPRDS